MRKIENKEWTEVDLIMGIARWMISNQKVRLDSCLDFTKMYALIQKSACQDALCQAVFKPRFFEPLKKGA